VLGGSPLLFIHLLANFPSLFCRHAQKFLFIELKLALRTFQLFVDFCFCSLLDDTPTSQTSLNPLEIFHFSRSHFGIIYHRTV
jgi:hypothetical protein